MGSQHSVNCLICVLVRELCFERYYISSMVLHIYDDLLFNNKKISNILLIVALWDLPEG